MHRVHSTVSMSATYIVNDNSGVFMQKSMNVLTAQMRTNENPFHLKLLNEGSGEEES